MPHVHPLDLEPLTLPGLLEPLGLSGLERLEIPLLSALVTGEPLLLIGPHGSAKSAVVAQLARALGGTFHAYDASKALFEDVVGFPDPSSLAEGLVRYVPTPLSIWDKEIVFVDELSRATPAMQNKWLEIVRAQHLMGAPLPHLRHVFAAMNPPTYLGAHPLDPALAGRFAWIVPVPSFRELRDDARLAVLQAASQDDARLAPALHPTRPDPEDLGPRLHQTIALVRLDLPEIVARFDDPVCRYVLELEIGLSNQDVPLDGRRLGMIRRNILTALAVRQVTGTLHDARQALLEVVEQSMPHPALGAELDDGSLLLAHASAFQTAFHGARSTERDLHAILHAASPEEGAARYAEVAAGLDELGHDAVLTGILDAVVHRHGDARLDAAAHAVRFVVDLVHELRVPPEVRARMLGWYAEVTGLKHHDDDPWSSPPIPAPDHLQGPTGSLAIRLAAELTKSIPGSGEPVDPAEVAALLPGLETRLARRTGGSR